MGQDLFEIRSRGKEGICRAFFCTIVKNEILILHEFYMKYSANQRRISSFVKIVNFVRQARATKDQICLMAVIKKS